MPTLRLWILSAPLLLLLIPAAASARDPAPLPDQEPWELEAVDLTGVEPGEGRPKGPQPSRFWYGPAKIGLFVVISFALLETQRSIWEEDRDYGWGDFGDRFTSFDQWRLENNYLSYNMMGHVLWGWGFYIACRPYMGRLASVGFAALGSTLFEVLVEHREVVSISDLVVTPVAGAAAGEAFHQLQHYYATADGHEGVGQQFLAVLFNPFKALDDLVFGKWTYPYRSRARFTDKDFQTGLAGPLLAQQQGETQLKISAGLRLRLATLPGYLRPWHRGGLTGRTAFAELRFLFVNGWEEFRFAGHAVWAGVHRQRIEGRRDPQGYSLFLGVGTRVEHDHRQLGRLKDWFGTVNIIGPGFEGVLLRGPLRLRLQADLFWDFSMPRTLALEELRELEPETYKLGGRGVLEHDYYYALGLTLTSRIVLQAWDLRLEGDYVYNHAWSIDGQHRNAELETRVQSFEDAGHRLDLTLGLRLGGRWLPLGRYLAQNRTYLNLSLQLLHRRGWMTSDGLDLSREATRLVLGGQLLLEL